jgi:hypothetical protein
MATLNKSVLGKISGALGDLVFRQMNGENFVRLRPKSFIPGTDEASVNRRNKFRFASKFASSVDNLSELRQVWEEYAPAKSPFKSLFSSNYPYIDPAGQPASLKVTPQSGFGTSTSLITVSPVEIQAELNPLGDRIGIDTSVETSVMLLGVLHLYNPLDVNSPAYQFINIISEELPLQTDSPLVFSVPLMNQETELYNLYGGREVYLALVTLDDEGNVIHFSNTFRKA